MNYGFIPSYKNCLAAYNNSEANIVTDVVPSPTSSSYDLEASINIQAAGWFTSKRDNIVAPSLDIVWPQFPYIILSIPHGPKVVFIISAIA